MRKIVFSLCAISILFSCSNNEQEVEQEDNSEQKIIDNKKVNNPPEGMYTFHDIYGNDSLDSDGNTVYGTAEEVGLEINKEVVPQIDSVSGKRYTLGPRPDTPIPNSYGEDSITTEGHLVYPPTDTIWVEETDLPKK